MNLTYIYHSCYTIETDKLLVIIDYYKDTDEGQKGILHERLLTESKQIYVLSSHSHKDHFNPEILKWKEIQPTIKYIFSQDILDEGFAQLADATYIDRLDTYKDENLQIKAFGSTDLGISFLIELEGKKIFHAGDLNNWHWNEECPLEESQRYETNYLIELNVLAQEFSQIDLVLFPVDPRLGKDYMRGAEQFLDKIKTSIFAPMHFGENYDKANAFDKYAGKSNCTVFTLSQKGESIDF